MLTTGTEPSQLVGSVQLHAVSVQFVPVFGALVAADRFEPPTATTDGDDAG